MGWANLRREPDATCGDQVIGQKEKGVGGDTRAGLMVLGWACTSPGFCVTVPYCVLLDKAGSYKTQGHVQNQSEDQFSQATLNDVQVLSSKIFFNSSFIWILHSTENVILVISG